MAIAAGKPWVGFCYTPHHLFTLRPEMVFLTEPAHEARLMILCALVDGEKSVGGLEQLVQVKQAAISQQPARLRAEGLVSARRDGRLVWYSLIDPKAKQMIRLLHDMFCKQG